MAPSTQDTAEAPPSQIRLTPPRAARRKASRGRGSTEALTPVTLLSAGYLSGHINKKDLVLRLQQILKTLEDLANSDDEEIGPDDYPGLAGLAALLVEDKYLLHRDKDVRLYTALSCMEIFVFYAPEPPYDEAEILKIFPQITRQLSSLAVGTSQAHTQLYYKLLERFAEIKIGCVLVELTRTLKSSQKFAQDDSEEDDSDSDNDGEGKSKSPTTEDALEVLSELIRSILHSVSIEHPTEVSKHAAMAVSACVDEFDGTVPIPVLDEIIACISMGPVVAVTNPAFVKATAVIAASKKRGKKVSSKKLPPRMIQQTNQSFLVAASVIRRTEDRISTPMANLLNGLLNGDATVVDKTNIAAWDEQQPKKLVSKDSKNDLDGTEEVNSSTPNVWSIIYELHKVSPQILTTVIGTVAISLKSPNTEKRLRVTKLLGRLFYSPTSDIATKFHACYRDWTGRIRDIDDEIRKTMISCLIMIMKNKSHEEMLRREATESLIYIVTSDRSNENRIECVHSICNLVHHNGGKEESSSNSDSNAIISSRLLKAVGNRVSSKHKPERRDAITGLAQIYNRHYMREKLREVQNEGDDCDIDIILDTLHNTCSFEKGSASNKSPTRGRQRKPSFENEVDSYDLDEKYTFIPRLVFDSVYFTDQSDTEMRNRVVQIVDDVLLGSGTGSNSLSPTARATGLAMILNSIEDDASVHASCRSNAVKFMHFLLLQRAKLQRAIGAYVDARSRAEQCAQGSEEKLSANSVAMEKLEIVASLSAPISSSSGGSDNLEIILRKVHSARDKHIFRLLASISSPTHSPSARSRAFDELPKRTKSLGASTVSWVKSLARRAAMGNFLNVETISHCILLAQEAYHERDFDATMAFLKCINVAVRVYPSLCATKEGFANLVELFGECRSPQSPDVTKAIEECGMVTFVSGILAAAAPARANPPQLSSSQDIVEKSDTPNAKMDNDLESELVRLCTKDGTPEQSKHAVYILAGLTKEMTNTENPKRVFGRLLETLTSPSRLSLENKKIISVFATLSPVVECAPEVFISATDGVHGRKAVMFALSNILLGESEEKIANSDDKDDDKHSSEDASSSDEDSEYKTSRGGRRSSIKKGKNGQSESKLSLTCQRACAAMNFLVAHIRSTTFYQNDMPTKPRDSEFAPSAEHISTVITVLINIVQDSGLLPATRDQDECKGDRERAALRQCAAINLFRLSDESLKLKNEPITSHMWHILSTILLDEDRSVRENVMEELTCLLKGTGHYRRKCSPNLRFLAYVALCADTDMQTHSSANGHAANVGRLSTSVKVAALESITLLRRTFESASLQSRAISREAERHFEDTLKVRLMPELAVPFAFHLLAFRPETPSAGGTGVAKASRTRTSKASKKKGKDDDDDDDDIGDIEDEDQHRMLSKRLRWLLEPLVQSLGENADNISFLIRLTEMIGNKYRPVSPSNISSETTEKKAPSSPNISALDLSLDSFVVEDELKQDRLSHAKLKVIVATARQVLLKFVKKDVNLTTYPGSIKIPGTLFVRSNFEVPSSTLEITKDAAKSKTDVGNLGDDSDSDNSFMEKEDDFADEGRASLGGLHLSPIPQSRSPTSLALKQSTKDSDEEITYDADIPMEDYDIDNPQFEEISPTEKQDKSTAVQGGSDGKESAKEKDAGKSPPSVGVRRSSRRYGKDKMEDEPSVSDTKRDRIDASKQASKKSAPTTKKVDKSTDRKDEAVSLTESPEINETNAGVEGKDDSYDTIESPFEELPLTEDEEEKEKVSGNEVDIDQAPDNDADDTATRSAQSQQSVVLRRSSRRSGETKDADGHPKQEITVNESEKKQKAKTVTKAPRKGRISKKTDAKEVAAEHEHESMSGARDDISMKSSLSDANSVSTKRSTRLRKVSSKESSKESDGTSEMGFESDDIGEKKGKKKLALSKKKQLQSVTTSSKSKKRKTSSPVRISIGVKPKATSTRRPARSSKSRFGKSMSQKDELDFLEDAFAKKKSPRSIGIKTSPKATPVLVGDTQNTSSKLMQISSSSKRSSMSTPVTPRRKRRRHKL